MPLFLERPHSGGHLILYQFGGTHCHCLYRIIHPSCENLHLSGLFLWITLLKQRSGNFCLFLSLRRYRITAKKWEKRRDCIVPYWVLEVPYYITGLIETALRLSWGAILLVLGVLNGSLYSPNFHGGVSLSREADVAKFICNDLLAEGGSAVGYFGEKWYQEKCKVFVTFS